MAKLLTKPNNSNSSGSGGLIALLSFWHDCLPTQLHALSYVLLTVYNGAEELLRIFCWHSSLFKWMTDDQLTNPCNDHK